MQHVSSIAKLPKHQNAPTIADQDITTIVDIWCQVLFSKGLLSEPKYFELVGRCRDIQKDHNNLPHATIYLVTSAEIAMERIRKRDRVYERNITSDLLEALQQGFDKAYPASAADVIRVDSNDPVEDYVNDIARKLRPLLERYGDDDSTGRGRVDAFMDIFEDRRVLVR